MAKSLQSLQFQIADREARIADLEAENVVLRQKLEAALAELDAAKAVFEAAKIELGKTLAALAAVTQQRDAAVEALRGLRQDGFFYTWNGEVYICKKCGRAHRNVEKVEHGDNCAVKMALAALALVRE